MQLYYSAMLVFQKLFLLHW